MLNGYLCAQSHYNAHVHVYMYRSNNSAAMDTHSMTAQLMQQGQRTNTRAIVRRDTQESCLII